MSRTEFAISTLLCSNAAAVDSAVTLKRNSSPYPIKEQRVRRYMNQGSEQQRMDTMHDPDPLE
jgi:hypothetical protein